MIEVEKTLPVDEESRSRLIAGAEFLGQKILTDTYYDSADYRLTLSDRWLRNRNGRFELKIPVRGPFATSAPERYEELEDDASIAKELGLPAGGLADTLAAAGYTPFCTITNTRQQYTKEGFHIDFDSTDSGYKAVEIELMVAAPEDTEAASRKINEFASKHGLPEKIINGKVVEFIRRNRPEHFAALDRAGVVYH